jgi:hypothetical protein
MIEPPEKISAQSEGSEFARQIIQEGRMKAYKPHSPAAAAALR